MGLEQYPLARITQLSAEDAATRSRSASARKLPSKSVRRFSCASWNILNSGAGRLQTHSRWVSPGVAWSKGPDLRTLLKNS